MRQGWWWSSVGTGARVLRAIAWLLLSALALTATHARDGSVDRAPGVVGEVALSALPRQARETLDLIKRGGPFPYRKDGTVFQNREKRLPLRPRGYYREYTVRTPFSRDRGARRIVAGSGRTGDPATSGEYYYTDDHYETFRRIRE
ncbi:MAG: ribonuclease [Burkholderiaceae bacterium]|jgi:ribonuclease T1|nr:ribonuclease [Burkholderiaceae bacterium]